MLFYVVWPGDISDDSDTSAKMCGVHTGISRECPRPVGQAEHSGEQHETPVGGSKWDVARTEERSLQL